MAVHDEKAADVESTKTDQEDQVDSKQPEQPSSAVTPAPDGGLAAWLTILGCFLAFFSTNGFVTGFGVFQAYYEAILPNSSPDDISWIGSFQLWCIPGMAIPSVIMNAHFGPHITLAIGTFFTVLGVMTASAASEYYQFLLSHGVCTGIGIGLVFLPCIILPNQWFTKRRALAVTLAVGGSSVGGVIWPIMVNQLLNYDGVGYPWTMRAVGFVQLGTMSAAICLIRNKVPRNKAVKLKSFPFVSALKQPGILWMALGLLLHFFGIYIPFFYISLSAISVGASTSTAFYASAVLNAATFFGRLVMGVLSLQTGACNMLAITVFISAMLAFAWQGVVSVAGIFVWAVAYGWFSGASIALQSPAGIPLVPGQNLVLIGPYIAILCQVSSFGNLAGGPVAGALLRLRATDGRAATQHYEREDFHPVMWFTGSILLGALVAYQFARHSHTPKLIAKI